MGTHKKERVSQILLSFLAQELREATDSRLGAVTLTGVDLTPDLRTAWVFFTALPPAALVQSELAIPVEFLSKEQIREVMSALEEARISLQRRIGDELQLRYTPVLKFRYDDSLEAGAKIDQLLRQANPTG